MKVLLLRDERPGHYHLSEGVVAALERITAVDCQRLTIKRRRFIPARLLRFLLTQFSLSPEYLLSFGYGLKACDVPDADLLVSSGGETLIANYAAARLRGAANIFCGSLRRISPDYFTLIITSYERFSDLPRHLVTIKPNLIDPEKLGRPEHVPTYSRDHPPRYGALLIGGDSGLFHYRREEWEKLLDFLTDSHQNSGTKWLLSSSPRTPGWLCDEIAERAEKSDAIADFIDYRTAGPGTLEDLFCRADVVLCTEDSSTMISEAICARLPVVGISPEDYRFKAEELDYRQTLSSEGWCRFLPLATFDIQQFETALSEIKPLQDNHLDRLAKNLKERLQDSGCLKKP